MNFHRDYIPKVGDRKPFISGTSMRGMYAGPYKDLSPSHLCFDLTPEDHVIYLTWDGKDWFLSEEDYQDIGEK